LDEFQAAVRPALETPGPHFFVAKIELDVRRQLAPGRRLSERAVKEAFVQALWRHPDYPEPRRGSPEPERRPPS
jgi:hypothetical protein